MKTSSSIRRTSSSIPSVSSRSSKAGASSIDLKTSLAATQDNNSIASSSKSPPKKTKSSIDVTNENRRQSILKEDNNPPALTPLTLPPPIPSSSVTTLTINPTNSSIFPPTPVVVSSSSSVISSSLIKVAIRIRPLIPDELRAQEQIVWGCKDRQIHTIPQNFPNLNSAGSMSSSKRTQAVEPPPNLYHHQHTNFTFDHIFTPESHNQEIFERIVRDIVTASMEGYHGSVFTYGQTSSGKTFTMNGNTTTLTNKAMSDVGDSSSTVTTPGGNTFNSKQVGVITQAIYYCFEYIAQHIHERDFSLRVSYLEVYNEQIRDLLATENTAIKLQFDPKQGCSVLSGVRELLVSTVPQVLLLMKQGESQRHIGMTDMNEKSSRAHTLFKIMIESKEKNASSNLLSGNTIITRVSTLNLVDLAGSENAKMTNNSGDRAKEARFINQSLLTLSTIIQRLSEESVNNVNYNSNSASANNITISMSTTSNRLSMTTSSINLNNNGNSSTPTPGSNRSSGNLTGLVFPESLTPIANTSSNASVGSNVQSQLLQQQQQQAQQQLQQAPKRNMHLPYRDSKLTRILENALDGNARIAIICTISPTFRCLEETVNTLKFGTRAKMIRMNAKVNEQTLDSRSLLRIYRTEIEALKIRLQELETLQAQAQARSPHRSPRKPHSPKQISPTAKKFHSANEFKEEKEEENVTEEIKVMDMGVGSHEIGMSADEQLPPILADNVGTDVLVPESVKKDDGLVVEASKKSKKKSRRSRVGSIDGSENKESKNSGSEEGETLDLDIAEIDGGSDFDSSDYGDSISEYTEFDDDFLSPEFLEEEEQKRQRMIEMIEAMEKLLLSVDAQSGIPNAPRLSVGSTTTASTMSTNSTILQSIVNSSIAKKYGIDIETLMNFNGSSLISNSTSLSRRQSFTTSNIASLSNESKDTNADLNSVGLPVSSSSSSSPMHYVKATASSASLVASPEQSMKSTRSFRYSNGSSTPGGPSGIPRLSSGINLLGTGATPRNTGSSKKASGKVVLSAVGVTTSSDSMTSDATTIVPQMNSARTLTSITTSTSTTLANITITGSNESGGLHYPEIYPSSAGSPMSRAKRLSAGSLNSTDDEPSSKHVVSGSRWMVPTTASEIASSVLASGVSTENAIALMEGYPNTSQSSEKFNDDEDFSTSKRLVSLTIDTNPVTLASSSYVGATTNSGITTTSSTSTSKTSSDLNLVFAKLVSHAEMQGIKQSPAKFEKAVVEGNNFEQTKVAFQIGDISTGSQQDPPLIIKRRVIHTGKASENGENITQPVIVDEKEDNVLQGISRMLTMLKGYVSTANAANAAVNSKSVRTPRQSLNPTSPSNSSRRRLERTASRTLKKRTRSLQYITTVSDANACAEVEATTNIAEPSSKDLLLALRSPSAVPTVENAEEKEVISNKQESITDHFPPAVTQPELMASSSGPVTPIKTAFMSPTTSNENLSFSGAATPQMVSKSLFEQVKLDLTLKDADNQFLLEELENKDRMLAMLTDGLKEVQDSQLQWLHANQELSSELEKALLLNQAYKQEIQRLTSMLEQFINAPQPPPTPAASTSSVTTPFFGASTSVSTLATPMHRTPMHQQTSSIGVRSASQFYDEGLDPLLVIDLRTISSASSNEDEDASSPEGSSPRHPRTQKALLFQANNELSDTRLLYSTLSQESMDKILNSPQYQAVTGKSYSNNSSSNNIEIPPSEDMYEAPITESHSTSEDIATVTGGTMVTFDEPMLDHTTVSGIATHTQMIQQDMTQQDTMVVESMEEVVESTVDVITEMEMDMQEEEMMTTTTTTMTTTTCFLIDEQPSTPPPIHHHLLLNGMSIREETGGYDDAIEEEVADIQNSHFNTTTTTTTATTTNATGLLFSRSRSFSTPSGQIMVNTDRKKTPVIVVTEEMEAEAMELLPPQSRLTPYGQESSPNTSVYLLPIYTEPLSTPEPFMYPEQQQQPPQGQEEEDDYVTTMNTSYNTTTTTTTGGTTGNTTKTTQFVVPTSTTNTHTLNTLTTHATSNHHATYRYATPATTKSSTSSSSSMGHRSKSNDRLIDTSPSTSHLTGSGGTKALKTRTRSNSGISSASGGSAGKAATAAAAAVNKLQVGTGVIPPSSRGNITGHGGKFLQQYLQQLPGYGSSSPKQQPQTIDEIAPLSSSPITY